MTPNPEANIKAQCRHTSHGAPCTSAALLLLTMERVRPGCWLLAAVCLPTLEGLQGLESNAHSPM